MLGPLMSASLDNAAPRRSGTPPDRRPRRRGTVRAHLDSLAEVSGESRTAYLSMARLTADRALAAGLLRPERAAALLEVLSAGKEAASE